MANCAQNCTEKDPCFCIQTTSPPPPPPPCSDDECCLKACNAVLDCTDAVGPCAQTGAFNLTSLDHIVTGCTTPESVQYVLEEFDSNFFAAVTISKAGVVTWTTGGPDTVGKYGTICFRLVCPTDCDDCISLSAVGYIQIGVANLCQDVICDDTCEVCDPCTGTCIEQEVKIEIQ